MTTGENISEMTEKSSGNIVENLVKMVEIFTTNI